MTKTISTGLALALATSAGMATAGGLDRSGQSVDILFEAGNHAELSFGYVRPSVTGEDALTAPTGSLAPAYGVPGLGVVVDPGNGFSFGFIYDTPFGASLDYPIVGSLYDGLSAEVNSDALTALLRYNVSERIFVFGGASSQSTSGVLSDPTTFNAPVPYTLDLASATGVGYVAGAAYQIPEMALRVALTYRSEISATHDVTEVLSGVGTFLGTADVTTPQSVNLEFQSGINPKTLIFGSIRWVDWSSFALTMPTAGELLAYDRDVLTFKLGAGRKLSESLSAAVTVGYERATGDLATPLAPTDGYVSLGAGVTYTMGNAKITAGINHYWLGDATDVAGGVFTGNTTTAGGISVGFSF